MHAALHGDLEMGAATMHITCKWSQVADFIPIYTEGRCSTFYTTLHHLLSISLDEQQNGVISPKIIQY